MKYKELTTKSEAEARKMLEELRSEAYDLRLKTRLNEQKQTHKIKAARKDIARIETYLHTLSSK